MFDFSEYLKKIIENSNIDNEHYYPSKHLKINTINNQVIIEEDINYYDFDTEDSEWLYTPVPFLTNFKGMHSSDPFLAFCLSVSIFSLAGIPPLIGFFAKQQVLLASMQLDYFYISIIAILTSVIGAGYYLRIIKFIYFYDDVFMPLYINNNNSSKPLFTLNSLNYVRDLPMLPSNSLSLIIAILTNISLFYILKPYVLINIIHMITIPMFII